MTKKIMVVDDSVSIRMLLSLTLTGAGYDVVEAVDGEDALEKLKSAHFDMLIVDINMPHIDGIELIRQVRTDVRHKFIPIFMLTTESHSLKRHEGKAAGATGWITKPFRAVQLLTIIDNYLEGVLKPSKPPP